MIKRFVIGTLITAIVAVLLAGGFVGYTLYEIQGLVNEVEEVEQAFRDTNRDFEYDEFTSGTLDLRRFEAFRRVRREVGRQMGRGVQSMLGDLERKEQRARSGEQVGILSIMRTLRGHFREQRDIAMELARALNREKMSAREYRDWTLLTFEVVRARKGASQVYGDLWRRYEMAEQFLLLFTSGLSPGRRAGLSMDPHGGIIDRLIPDTARTVGAAGDEAETESEASFDGAEAEADTPHPFTILDREDMFEALHDELPEDLFEEMWRENSSAGEPLVAPLPGAAPPVASGDAPAAPSSSEARAQAVEIPMWALLDLIVIETRDETLIMSPSSVTTSPSR